MSNTTESKFRLKINLAIFVALNVALLVALVLALPELSKKVFGDCIVGHFRGSQKNTETVSCGKRRGVHGNVWGGKPSMVNAWPWLVAFKVKADNKFFCAGSLISVKHVVSAAHCFQEKYMSSKKEPKDISALVGKHNLRVNDEEGSVAYDISEIILHKDWNNRGINYDADISLIVLETEVDLSKPHYVGIVCLPPASDSEVTGNGTVVGWGIIEWSHANIELQSYTPNELKLPAVSRSQCFKAEEDFLFLSSNRTFCAGFINQEKSICKGDNGGGFYVLDRSSRAYNLVGIVSASLIDLDYNPCRTDTYTLFTDVTKFVDWIKGKINEPRPTAEITTTKPTTTRSTTTSKLTTSTATTKTTRKTTTTNPTASITTTKPVRCGKIVGQGLLWGGEDSISTAWPWLVAFQIKANNKFLCAGSLISVKHVVSGAQCFQEKFVSSKKEPEDILALVGKHDLRVDDQGGSHDVSDIIIHEDWNYKSFDNDADISLIVLETEVDLSKRRYVRVVCLPPASDSEVTGIGTVVGWGISRKSVANNRNHDFTPRELELPAVSKSQCFKANEDFRIESSNRTFCAGFISEGKSICKGDNGGGFYVLDQKARAYNLVGIVSAALRDQDGDPCRTDAYTIFTDVTKFVDWIKTKIIKTVN